jgi:GNAT superfamily N-acetyltransferase
MKWTNGKWDGIHQSFDRRMSSPKFAESRLERVECFDVMKQLRPALVNVDDFIQRVERMEKTNHYRLLYVKDAGNVVAVAGIRAMETLWQGKLIYVDDLVTSENTRSKGFGKVLIDYLKKYVKDQKYDALTLDSGVQRFEAHKFYFTNGFYISSYHFNCKL